MFKSFLIEPCLSFIVGFSTFSHLLKENTIHICMSILWSYMSIVMHVWKQFYVYVWEVVSLHGPCSLKLPMQTHLVLNFCYSFSSFFRFGGFTSLHCCDLCNFSFYKKSMWLLWTMTKNKKNVKCHLRREKCKFQHSTTFITRHHRNVNG